MGLAHGRRQLAPPGAVEVAEPAVSVAVRMDSPILLPQQRQRHPALAQLAMQRRPVGERPAVLGDDRRRREHQPLQILVRKTLGQRPRQAGAAGAAQIRPRRGGTDGQAGGNPPLRQAGGMQPQNVADLAHGQSLSGHPRSFRKRRELSPRSITRRRPSNPPRPGRDQSEPVVTIIRKQRSQSLGMRKHRFSPSTPRQRLRPA
jgi:hypothetical protein